MSRTVYLAYSAEAGLYTVTSKQAAIRFAISNDGDNVITEKGTVVWVNTEKKSRWKQRMREWEREKEWDEECALEAGLSLEEYYEREDNEQTDLD